MERGVRGRGETHDGWLWHRRGRGRERLGQGRGNSLIDNLHLSRCAGRQAGRRGVGHGEPRAIPSLSLLLLLLTAPLTSRRFVSAAS